MTFDPDIHHRRSLRLQGHDYSQPGAYFVTMVTHERGCIFGEITDGVMVLSKYGQVALQVWKKLPSRFQNVELDVFVIMPNHVHGIILLDDMRRGIAEGAGGPGAQSSSYAPTE